MLHRICRRIVRLNEDETGQASVEWVLLLGCVGLPLVGITFRYLLPTLAEYYRMVTFLETLPFP